jgi:hypothetical protein
MQYLVLPKGYEPMIPNNDKTEENGAGMICVADAMAVLLCALRYNNSNSTNNQEGDSVLYRMSVDVKTAADTSSLKQFRVNQVYPYEFNQVNLYGISKRVIEGAKASNPAELTSALTDFLMNYTVYIRPDSYVHHHVYQLDKIQPVNSETTKGCVYVLYVVNFSNQLTGLIQSTAIPSFTLSNATADGKLCRIFRVRKKALW